jgi:hypothetical protein
MTFNTPQKPTSLFQLRWPISFFGEADPSEVPTFAKRPVSASGAAGQDQIAPGSKDFGVKARQEADKSDRSPWEGEAWYERRIGRGGRNGVTGGAGET